MPIVRRPKGVEAESGRRLMSWARSLPNYIEKLLKEEDAKHESRHARTKVP